MDRLDRNTCDEALRRLEDTCGPCQFEFEASVLESVRQRLRRTDLPPELLTRIRRLLGDAGRAV